MHRHRLPVRDELQLLIFSSIVLVMSKEVLVKNAVAVLTDVGFDDLAAIDELSLDIC
jgi:hypothetical protein